ADRDADALALRVEIGQLRIGEIERTLLREHLDVQAAAQAVRVAASCMRLSLHGAAARRAAERPPVHHLLLYIQGAPPPSAHAPFAPRADRHVRYVVVALVEGVRPRIAGRCIDTEREPPRRVRHGELPSARRSRDVELDIRVDTERIVFLYVEDAPFERIAQRAEAPFRGNLVVALRRLPRVRKDAVLEPG